MQEQNRRILAVLGVFLVFAALSCAGGARSNLPRIQSPTESELKQNWDDYTVFYRNNLAFIFQFKDDKRIVLDNRWIQITSEEMMADSQIGDLTWVRQIQDRDGQIYGYLVHRTADRANVKKIDENTAQLYYHYVVNCCGP